MVSFTPLLIFANVFCSFQHPEVLKCTCGLSDDAQSLKFWLNCHKEVIVQGFDALREDCVCMCIRALVW